MFGEVGLSGLSAGGGGRSGGGGKISKGLPEGNGGSGGGGGGAGTVGRDGIACWAPDDSR